MTYSPVGSSISSVSSGLTVVGRSRLDSCYNAALLIGLSALLIYFSFGNFSASLASWLLSS